MKATVIMPCYNSESTIELQMEALARQDWQDNWEFILADNGSTDRSVEIVKAYEDRIPNMRILNVYSGKGTREPASASYNKAFKVAQGDVFITCESDDEALEGWLVHMVDAMKKENVHFVGSAIENYRLNDDDLVMPGQGMQSSKAGFPNFVGPLKLPFAVGCTIGISRKLYDTIGDFDVGIGHLWDIDYCWRTQLAGFDLTFVPEAEMSYRMRDTFKARYKQGKMYGLCAARITAKYGRRSLWRYIAYNGYQLCMSSLLTIASIFPGTRSARYRIWHVGNSLGQLLGLHYVIKGRRGIMEIPENLKHLTVPRPRHEHEFQ